LFAAIFKYIFPSVPFCWKPLCELQERKHFVILYLKKKKKKSRTTNAVLRSAELSYLSRGKKKKHTIGKNGSELDYDYYFSRGS